MKYQPFTLSLLKALCHVWGRFRQAQPERTL